jgi:hypothetical protein
MALTCAATSVSQRVLKSNWITVLCWQCVDVAAVYVHRVYFVYGATILSMISVRP